MKSELPEGWELKPLPDAIAINPRRDRVDGLSDGSLVSFVPMSAVSEQAGTIVQQIARPLREVRRGYTFFREGDVLFAKITPCMQNGKAAIAMKLANGIGFGSTEFHVLRPKDGVLPEWVLHFVRRQTFREEAARNFTGSVGQQRVPRAFLEGQEIPIPPIAEQREILTRLEKMLRQVQDAEALRQAAIRDAAALLPTVLRDASRRAGSEDWERVPLGEVARIAGPLVDPREPSYRHLPHISGESIESGTGRLLAFRTAADDGVTSGKYHFPPGAVLYSKIRPYLRKACRVTFEGLCSADVYPLVTNPVADPDYLVWALLGDEFSEYAVTNSARARMPKLNREQLFGYLLPLPPMHRQRELVRIVESTKESIEQLHAAQVATTSDLKRLGNAILDAAFQGDLQAAKRATNSARLLTGG